jgi:hypothetical protein
MLIDETEEIEQDEEQGVVAISIPQSPPTLTPEETLRFELLNLSKDILLGKAAMKWETHKQYDNVSIHQIIEEAESMFRFVKGRDES